MIVLSADECHDSAGLIFTPLVGEKILSGGFMYKFLDETKSNLAVDTDTGEVVEAKTVVMPVGSKVITPKQQEAYDEWREQQLKKETRRKIQDEFGYFYFVMKEHEFGNISAENAARLVYLCTFLNYNNEFVWSQRRRVMKSDLQDILLVSLKTAYKFWNEVKDKYIIDCGINGLKLVCPDIIRGRIDNNKPYTKFYIDGIRKIYKACPTNKHRYLGYIYKLLPYTNIEYNIFCHNPDETNIDNVKPLTLTEICSVIGLEESHTDRLRKIYRSLIFECGGKDLYALIFIYNQSGIKSMRGFINPMIFYSGSNYTKVEILKLFAVKK